MNNLEWVHAKTCTFFIMDNIKFNNACYKIGKGGLKRHGAEESAAVGMGYLNSLGARHPLGRLGKLSIIKGIVKCIEAGLTLEQITYEEVAVRSR